CAEIDYRQAYCKADGTIDTMRLTHVCRRLPYCENHYPNIAMTGNYGTMITWEACQAHYTFEDSQFVLHRAHYAILHGRFNWGGWTQWYALKGFDAAFNSLFDDTLSLFPVVSVSDPRNTAHTNDTTWWDYLRLVWHSPFDEQAHIAHYGWLNGNYIKPFQTVAMPDES